jgi:glycosyltransferase involved in cell wall biosynthesis
MKRLVIPKDVEWELIIVNNNSNDDTEDVVASFLDHLPVRRLFETRQGLSYARNCALSAVSGELVLWTDDDALVEPNWLKAYVEASLRWPDAAYFGGKIKPLFDKEPPSEFPKNSLLFSGILMTRNFGEEERPFRREEVPYGANMAIRQWVFKKWRFNPNLGVVGDSHIRGEESDFFLKLRREGLEGIWVPNSIVFHPISTERMSEKYIWEYLYGYGRTKIRMEGIPKGKLFSGTLGWVYCHYWMLLGKYYCQRLLCRPGWLETYGKMAIISGMMRECRSLGMNQIH